MAVTDEETHPETFDFENFGQKMTLLKQDQYYRMTHFDSDQNRQIDKIVKLSNRLIIKTNKLFKKNTLYQFHSQIVDVTPVFLGSLHNYYIVEIQDEALLFAVLQVLKNNKGIKLVQPDILQIQIKPLLTDAEKQQRKLNRIQKRKNFKANKNRQQSQAKSIVKMSSYLNSLGVSFSLLNNQGKGVKIAIIDDGFKLDHPGLRHVTSNFSYDISNNRSSVAPQALHNSHGTKVAGIIFAADPQSPMRGIAPLAELIPLVNTDTWTSNTLLSFQLASLADADIINCSWLSPWLMQPVAEVIDDLARTGRDGKGTVIVFSAGNQGQEIAANSTEASINAAIVVGAYDSHFKRLSKSNYGPSVDVMAYGGKLLTTFPSGKYGYFSETSLASAIISGMVALMLSKQPDMSLQQVQQKLQLLFDVEAR